MDQNHLRPDSTYGLGGPKLRQINDAKEMQQAVMDRAARAGVEPPAYEFLELIGKGTYGRVYKSVSLKSKETVAVKIIEVDKPDYESSFEARNDTIENFRKEISALQRLKDSNAKNITMLHDAFTFHSQLWLVSEYCHGGSLTTLLKACPERRMDEQYIIPIARELAVALKYIHDADIVHRDIKCANVLIMEDGTLRLADFGVAGIFESNASKRQTIIGTPHWMPLELVKELGNESADVQYGTEVDCWAYGCAVYEMATGHGPNNRVRPMELANALRRNAPRLEENGPYSERLREFVDYCLQMDPKARPSVKMILEHPFLANTSKRYPTESLQTLVKQFYAWEMKGGERKSLFYDFGAALPEDLAGLDQEQEDWYFSTTLEFEKKLEDEAHEALYESLTAEELTPTGLPKLTPRERRLQAEKDGSAERGAKALGAIFDTKAGEYTYSERFEPQRRESDLPFRNMGSDRAADRTTMIDLDMADTGFTTVPSLANISTLRANRTNHFFTDSDEEEERDDEDDFSRQNRNSNRKTTDWKMPLLSAPAEVDANRRTVDWKFPSATANDAPYEDELLLQRTSRYLGGGNRPGDAETGVKRDTMAFRFPMSDHAPAMSTDGIPSRPAARPPLKHAATMPIGQQLDEHGLLTSPDRSSMIDLDLAVPSFATQPPTASTSTTFPEPATSASDPLDLDDPPDFAGRTLTANNRSSHRQSYSEPNARASGDSQLTGQADMNASWHARDPSTAASEAHMLRSSSLSHREGDSQLTLGQQTGSSERGPVVPPNGFDAPARRRRMGGLNRDSGDTNGSVTSSAEGSQMRVYQPTGSQHAGLDARLATSFHSSSERGGGQSRRDRRALILSLEGAARGLAAHGPVMKLLYGIHSADERAYVEQYRAYVERGRQLQEQHGAFVEQGRVYR